ncbi:amino acid permease/ SLC12A domain-containing protein [Aspergillus carlsbadensis]|nr:amino acid permease/ SLC12A domain-containing protein [Aspergillus carlsbadensis]
MAVPKDEKTADATTADMEMGPVQGDQEEIRRDLQSRHINMIALAGMIGTGLFLTSGQVIAIAGPAGAFLAYILMGLVTAGVSYTTGEITSFSPWTGAFVRHATKFVEPALGAATGWNFWYTMCIAGPADVVAASNLVQYWRTDINVAVWVSVFGFFIAAVNMCNVRLYGESEVFFSSLKIMLIIGLIIGGIVINCGGGPDGEYLGFTYWDTPGAFNEYIASGATGRFLAFWKVLLTSAYSFGNIQIVAIAGSETRNPRVVIPSATRKTFLRVLVFYVLSIFIVGLIVPSSDPSLTISTGTAQQSPFVIAFTRAGVSVLPHIINAVVCTSAISAGSGCIFIASRTLYGLSRDGHAPRFFQKCNRFGTPFYAVGLSCAFLPLSYMTLGSGASVVFGWFVNITTVAGLIGWVVIQGTYLRFFYGLRAQGFDRRDLPYRNFLQPYAAWATLFMVVMILIFSGYDVFTKGNFTASGFLTSYLNIGIFAVLYIFFKFYLKSKVVPLKDIDFQSEFDAIEQEKASGEYVPEPERVWWKRWIHLF